MHQLTSQVLDDLASVVAALDKRDPDSLTAVEWRTRIWARSSLAVLCGILADAALAGAEDWLSDS